MRIELFDTEVDSIRDFDVETQRSNDNINQVEITTASDYIITDEVIQHLQNELKKHMNIHALKLKSPYVMI